MTEKHKLHDLLVQSGLIDDLSPSFTDHLIRALPDVPPMLATFTFLKHCNSMDAKETPKGMIKKFQAYYPGLLTIEKCMAGRLLSAEAHLATPETDEKLVRAFDKAYAVYAAAHDNPEPKPRLISADSDFAQASGGRILGKQGSLIVTSHLVHALSDTQLEAVISHELGHLTRHLNPELISPLVKIPLKSACTLNAYRRWMEYDADRFAVRTTGSADPLVTALAHMREHNDQLTAVIHRAMAEILVYARETDKAPSALLWLAERIIDPASKAVTRAQGIADSAERSCMDKILDTRKYPSIAERAAAMRAEEQKMRS